MGKQATLTIFLLLSAVSLANAQQQKSAHKQITKALQQHCYKCHGDKEQEAGLNLQRLVQQRPLIRNRTMWRKVIDQLELGGMPPKEAKQPSKADRQKLVERISYALTHVDWEKIKNPGTLVARRLTNTEYNNTVRDLLGVKIRPADKFPADLKASSGFDNSSNTLFVQTLLMEKYIQAAAEVAEVAYPRTSKQPVRRRAVEKFLSRAFRRPATKRQVDQAMKQAAQGGMKRVVYASLLSPHFLMRIEQRQSTSKPYRVDPWDLANRLSYFLWSSMPDARLLALARQGKLRDPRVVNAEVDRMVQDPRAGTLGSVFAAQWLGYEHLGTRVRLDPIDNPWCTDTLMTAMQAESSMFFVSLIRENKPLQRLIKADYTYLNQELAKHYRIKNVRGTKMRRVQLTDPRRGGIFGQGSVLAVTSFPDRTSPVMRGKWILSDVLGTPPPEPPPNASNLARKIRRQRRLSFRQKMELHRASPKCASCHARIGPLGLSLENYDKFGRWRSRIGRSRIDSSGVLPNGTKFQGPIGLRRVIIVERMDDLTAQITRKMLAFALGRQLEYYDEPAVRKIVSAMEKNDYKMKTLLKSIVHSYPFQYKQNR